eukprot:CAMPEP_0204162778 /NCGR_PEP_ID=MMETSP0361-20130328/35847_1 /ASSEMBLY_ACC=CAM_ASM_000343 /TAXON_ID=268821 /ORGANISM="Scrippsiella Hangoei, Strain SHTV-5" /LENGTH=81 /DNA_ID=CAMNT_0051119415 /DNA_START=9 /DNA_END=252 /DNA_ORIENTATION=-
MSTVFQATPRREPAERARKDGDEHVQDVALLSHTLCAVVLHRMNIGVIDDVGLPCLPPQGRRPHVQLNVVVGHDQPKVSDE